MKHRFNIPAAAALLAALLLLTACPKEIDTPVTPDPEPEPSPQPELSEIYVSPSGSDSADGSKDSPMKSINKALSKAKPGYTIFLRGGTYKERVRLAVSGTQEKPLTIAAAQGESPVLDGGNGTGWTQEWNDYALVFQYRATDASLPPISTEEGVLVIDGASHVIVSGIGITGSPGAGIYCKKGSSYIKIDGCTISNCVAPGVCFGAENSASSHITVTNNTVRNCAQRSREAISLRTVDVFEVAYNTVEEVIKESIDAKSGCSNGSIHHNRIVRSGHCAIYLDAGFTSGRPVQQNISVYCNEIIDPLATGICVSSEAGNDCSDILIYNNLIYTPSLYKSRYVGNGAGIKVAVCSDDHSGSISNVTIYQNTVLGLRQQGIYVNYPKISNIIIANNISARHDMDPAGYNTIHGLDPENISWVNNLVFASGKSTVADHIVKDPKLSDPSAGNLKLTQSSPAIDAADGRYVSDIDFAGRKRPWGKACDIGAYEFIL